MKILFYINYSPDEMVNKDLGDTVEFDCVLKARDGVSVRTPQVEIGGDYAQFAKYNYAYIPDFNRYYYIVDVNFYRTGYFVLQLRCDVLKTFYPEFANNLAIAKRNQNIYNQYYTDNAQWSEAGEYFDRYVFDVPGFDGSTLLMVSTAGGFQPSGDPEE